MQDDHTSWAVFPRFKDQAGPTREELERNGRQKGPNADETQRPNDPSAILVSAYGVSTERTDDEALNDATEATLSGTTARSKSTRDSSVVPSNGSKTAHGGSNRKHYIYACAAVLIVLILAASGLVAFYFFAIKVADDGGSKATNEPSGPSPVSPLAPVVPFPQSAPIPPRTLAPVLAPAPVVTIPPSMPVPRTLAPVLDPAPVVTAPIPTATSVVQPASKIDAPDGQGGSFFGASVAMEGDTLVVGAWGATRPHNSISSHDGLVYVFSRVGVSWSLEASLNNGSPNRFEGDASFGYSVALSGDTAIVGDPVWTHAYFINRSGSTWTRGSISDSQTARFGESVAVTGNTAVVGVPRSDQNGQDSGSAFVYGWDGASWVRQAELLPSDGAATDRFGSTVAIDGDLVLVGMDNRSGAVNGKVYLFQRLGLQWTEQAILSASDGTPGASFGVSVTVAGNRLFVGAKRSNGKANSSGSVYTFIQNTSGIWTQEAKLTASDGIPNDNFGSDMAVDGSRLVVGADQADREGTGAAYVFQLSGGQWEEKLKLVASDGASGDRFGTVAVSGSTVVVGAWSDDDEVGGTDSGSIYFFDIGN